MSANLGLGRGRRLACVFACAGFASCGGSSPMPTAQPSPSPTAPKFDAVFVGSTPAPGGVLLLSPPNDTPVALSVTFSVTVPQGQAGYYAWTTAIQAAHPVGSGYIVPVVTSAAQFVTLAAGTQTITFTSFHTTNAICSGGSSPPASLSLDIEVRGAAPDPVLGKKFDVTHGLKCQ